MGKQTTRFLSLVLAMLLVFTSFDLTALAAGLEDETVVASEAVEPAEEEVVELPEAVVETEEIEKEEETETPVETPVAEPEIEEQAEEANGEEEVVEANGDDSEVKATVISSGGTSKNPYELSMSKPLATELTYEQCNSLDTLKTLEGVYIVDWSKVPDSVGEKITTQRGDVDKYVYLKFSPETSGNYKVMANNNFLNGAIYYLDNGEKKYVKMESYFDKTVTYYIDFCKRNNNSSTSPTYVYFMEGGFSFDAYDGETLLEINGYTFTDSYTIEYTAATAGAHTYKVIPKSTNASEGITYEYQWQNKSGNYISDIEGETNSTYTATVGKGFEEAICDVRVKNGDQYIGGTYQICFTPNYKQTISSITINGKTSEYVRNEYSGDYRLESFTFNIESGSTATLTVENIVSEYTGVDKDSCTYSWVKGYNSNNATVGTKTFTTDEITGQDNNSYTLCIGTGLDKVEVYIYFNVRTTTDAPSIKDIEISPNSMYCEALENNYNQHDAGYPILVGIAIKKEDYPNRLITLGEATDIKIDEVSYSDYSASGMRCEYTEDGVGYYSFVFLIGYYNLTEGTHTVSAKITFSCYDEEANNTVYYKIADAITGSVKCAPKVEQELDVTNYGTKYLSDTENSVDRIDFTYYREDIDSEIESISIYKHSDSKTYTEENLLAETTILHTDYKDYRKGVDYQLLGDFHGNYYSNMVYNGGGYYTKSSVKFSIAPESVTSSTYLDVVIKDTDGNRRIANKAIYYDKGSSAVVTSKWANQVSPMYQLNADSGNGYISIMIYGKRLTKTSIPNFYKDSACTGAAIASYVEDDKCSVINDTKNSMTYITLKKTSNWDDSDKVYYKLADGVVNVSGEEIGSFTYDDLAIYGTELTSKGLKLLVGSTIQENTNYKVKVYFSEKGKYASVTSGSYKATKSGDELYILVPATDNLYKKLVSLTPDCYFLDVILASNAKTYYECQTNTSFKANVYTKITIPTSGSSWMLCENGDVVANVKGTFKGTTTSNNQVVVTEAQAAELAATGKAYKLIVTNGTETTIETVEFDVNSKLVLFDKNGGELDESLASKIVTKDKTYGTLPTPTRVGYTFKGWATAATDGTLVTAKTKVENTTEQTLYAIWTPITYKVVYNPNGAKGKAVTVTATYDQVVTIMNNNPEAETTVKDVTRFAYAGYDFNGWKAADGTNVVVASTPKNLVSDSKLVYNLYAQWTPKTYTVKLYANNAEATSGTLTKGEGNLCALTVKHDDVIYLTGREFNMSGQTIIGWADTETGTKVKVKNGKLVINSDKNLYAIWGTGIYSLTYDLGEGAKAKNAASYTYNKDLVINAPARTGYTFSGWTVSGEGLTSAKAVEGAVDASNKLTAVDSKNKTIIPAGTQGALTLTANWTPITYKVEFDANTGSGTVAAKETVAYNTSETIAAAAFTPKNGYEFAGYCLSSSGKGKKLTETAENSGLYSLAGLSTKAGATVKVYALWKLVNYNITYDFDGGVGAKNPTTYNVTSKTFTLKSPTKAGYVFDGWTVTAASTVNKSEDAKKAITIAKGSYGPISLKAKWTLISYKVEFKAGGVKGATVSNNLEAKTVDGLGKANGQVVTISNGSFNWPKSKKGTMWYLKGLCTDKKGNGTYASETIDSYGYRAFTLGGLSSTDGATVTLYPIWINKTYTITYTSNVTGFKNPNPTTVAYSEKGYKLKAASKTGYVFNGWRLTWSGGYTVYGFNTEDNYTFYADFSPVAYTVKLNPNGATNTNQVISIPASYDSTIDLSAYASTYKKDGFIFLGFSTKKSGKAMTDDTLANLKNLTTKNKATVNLYPVWEKISTAQVNGLTTVKTADGIKVDFKAVKGTITKYEIQYSTTVNFTDATTTTVNATTNTGLVPAASLSASTLYYVRVREVKTDSYGKVVNGKWSVVNQIKY